jgi:hypothetical protein
MIDNLVSALAEETGMGLNDVRRILVTAPNRYKTYFIDKRSGGKRLIAHPARELKMLQRAFLRLVLNDLPIHHAATAYRIGFSLRDNAAPHAANGPILKMDLREFFPSIRGMDWVNYCRKREVFANSSDVDLSASLLFRRAKGESVLRLSIGAPTSPALSNVLMFEFDTILFNAVSDDYVIYTRYADDLTFSAPATGCLTGVQSIVSKTIREMRFPKLEINREKTRLVTTKYHRDVTGLTLSADGKVTVGQLRKRNIRAGVHNAAKGLLSPREMKVLAGHMAFANSVEPDLIPKLKEKHGVDVIERVMRSNGEDI